MKKSEKSLVLNLKKVLANDRVYNEPMAIREKRQGFGRPIEKPYTVEVGSEICRMVENGSSIHEVCEAMGFSNFQLFKWLRVYPDFANIYAQARANQAHALDSQASENVKLMLAGGMTPEQCRVANDLLKWQASKRLATVYGDKLQTQNDTSITVKVEYAQALPAAAEPVLEADFTEED